MDAAKARLEAEEARRDQSDSRGRAVALIVGVGVYSVIYPLVILYMYRRTDPDGSLPGEDLIPRKAALGYGITMSVVTLSVAIGTAYQ